MFGKICAFVVAMAVNGILSMVLCLGLFFVGALVLPFAAIPIEEIFGQSAAHGVLSCIMNSWTFRIVYAIIFVNLMMDSYNIRNVKSLFWKRKLVTVTMSGNQTE